MSRESALSTSSVETQRSPEPVPIHAQGASDAERVIGQIQCELQLLLAKHASIQKRIGVIKNTVIGLADVFGPDIINGELQQLLFTRAARRTPRPQPGLTELCRQILRGSSLPLTVRQVYGVMQEKYPSVLSGHKNPTASLLVVLRRLVSYGEAEAKFSERGARIWVWAVERKKEQDED